MIQVTNKRTSNSRDSVYVGRPSPLGNPFVIGRDGTRDEVIAKYRRWLWDKIQTNDKAVADELLALHTQHKLGGVLKLQCWCAPEPCHADVIKAALEWMECVPASKHNDAVKSALQWLDR